jgi:hypothetical protein
MTCWGSFGREADMGLQKPKCVVAGAIALMVVTGSAEPVEFMAKPLGAFS